jgi:uroporphyrinogen decarboxylase
LQSRFINALKRQPVDKTPLWIMRQAGRYLPEYRAVREQAGDFMTLCKTPELACEVTLQPLARFDLDAAIVFSDILTIPDALGLGLHFVANEGPKFLHPIMSVADIDRLGILDIGAELNYVPLAIDMIKRALPDGMPLIGFSGSPWTLATYMLEGGSSKQFHRAKGMLYQHPDAMLRLLDCLQINVTAYCLAQIAAGVDAIMLFDTWGGVLSDAAYPQFSLAFMQPTVAAIQKQYPEVPVILFSKGCGQYLAEQAATGCAALGLDWTVDIAAARAQVGTQVSLQGNMDPAILLSNEAVIRAEVERILTRFGNHPGHVFNLGHGITPDVDPAMVEVLVDAVHSFQH